MTSIILAIIVLSEGARRLPRDVIVLRRIGWAGWSLVQPARLGLGIYFVGWLIPATLPMVLRQDAAETTASRLLRGRTRIGARARRVRLALTLLRIGGLAVIAALVVVVPYAAWSRGAEGLLAGIFIVVWLDIALAAITYRALRRTGVDRRAALRCCAALLWPFDAVRAAEILQARVVAGVPRLAVAMDLVGKDQFMKHFRPVIYDMLTDGQPVGEFALIEEMIEPAVLASFVNRPPSERAGAAFCPRCGTSYQRGPLECSDCGVRLLAA